MRDERTYLLFLNAMLANKDFPLREHNEWMLEVARKNTPGSKATDIEILVRGRKEKSPLLGELGKDKTLLMFYDIDCGVCENVIKRIGMKRGLSEAISEGRLKVVAVYTEGDTDRWLRSEKIPSGWTDAIDPDNAVSMGDAYILSDTPELYLLDADGTVLLKGTSPDEVLQYLNRNSGGR